MSNFRVFACGWMAGAAFLMLASFVRGGVANAQFANLLVGAHWGVIAVACFGDRRYRRD